MKEKPKEKQTETEDIVKLKPIMGIRPGVYLTVIYSIILLVIFFFLLVFPGLNRPGAMLEVKTEPVGAAIRVNGHYMGTSGSRIPVPKGSHTIEAVLPGFETASAVHEIPGRVFGSLFFPIRYNIEFSLKAGDPAAVFTQAAADYAAWSFGGEPTSSWQIPLSLSEGAYRIGPQTNPQIAEILTAASRFAVTRAALRDLSRAKFLLDNAGLSPSPPAFTGSISDILTFLSENPGSAQWLSDLLPPESASVVRASSWYQKNTSQTAVLSSRSTGSTNRLNVAGLTFTGIPAGELKNFMISENPVPRSIFENFINENPEWKVGHTDYFEEEISGNSSRMYGSDTITGISWFAANAFCKWLTNSLPPSMSNMEVRLPTEAEWEYVAGYGIAGMEAQGWEWCADPFAPLEFTAPEWAVQAVGSTERSLRGRPSSSAQAAKASLPPEFSSPFVTFRPVISERSGGQ